MPTSGTAFFTNPYFKINLSIMKCSQPKACAHMGVGRIFPGRGKIIFPGGPKVIKFHFVHWYSKLRIPFLLKI